MRSSRSREDRGKIEEDRGRSRKIEGARRDRGRSRKIEKDRGRSRKDRGKIEERSREDRGKIVEDRGNYVFFSEPFLGNFRDAGVFRKCWADGLCEWTAFWGQASPLELNPSTPPPPPLNFTSSVTSGEVLGTCGEHLDC